MPYDTYVTAASGDFSPDHDTYVTAASTDFIPDQTAHDTYVTASSLDFTEDINPGYPDLYVKIIIANPEYLNPEVQWNSDNTKARIVNNASINLGVGEHTYYYIGGQPPVYSLPTGYVFSPGDSIHIYLQISNHSSYPYNWTKKGYAQIILGPEPILPIDNNSQRATRPQYLFPIDIWMARGTYDTFRFTIPDNKIFSVVRKRTDVTSQDIIGKSGIQAVMDTEIDGDKKTNWTESKFLGDHENPPGHTGDTSGLTPDDIDAAAAAQTISRFEADELLEGPFGLGNREDLYYRWYQKRKEQYVLAGKPFNDFGTYGNIIHNFNGDPWNYIIPEGGFDLPNTDYFKQIIANPRGNFVHGDKVKSIRYFEPGGLETIGVGAIIKHYADQPDYASRYYNKAFAAEVMAKGIKMTNNNTAVGSQPPPSKLVYLDWGKIEGLGAENSLLHNENYYTRTVYDFGILKTHGHPQVDYDWQVGNIFCIGFCRTSGYIIFDTRSPIDQFGRDPRKVKRANKQDPNPISWQWFPAGSSSGPILKDSSNYPGNAPVSDDGYPTEPIRWHDAGHEAAYYYSLCDATTGSPWLYCRYQFKNTGEWVEPKNDGTDILDHASANGGPYDAGGNTRRGRPDAMYRIKNNIVDVWAFDPSRGKDSYETIILNPVPNVMIEVNLQGSKLALFTSVNS